MADQYTPEEIRAISEEYYNAVKSGSPVTAELTARFKDASTGIKNYTAQLNQSLKALGSSILGVVGAMKDGKQGASAYNDSINAAADAVDSFASKFGILGKILGTLITAGARYAAEVNKQSDALFDTYKNLSQSGLSDAGGMRDIFDNMQKFGYGIEQLGTMTELLKANSKELAAFGGTAASGTKAFANAAADIQRSDIGKSLQMLGKTPDDINKGIAGFVRQQQLSGVSSANIQKDLAQRSAEYVKQLDLMSKLTGESAEALQANREQALAESAFNQTIYELKKKGDQASLDKAAELQKASDLLSRTPALQKEFWQGVGGDVSAMGKTLMISADAAQYTQDANFKAATFVDKFAKGADNARERMGQLYKLNALDDVLGSAKELSIVQSRYADDTAKNQEDRAKAEQELQTKGLDPATKAQVEMRIEQMKTRDSLQGMINKGIVPVTNAMEKLAGATETVAGAAPGTTPATGAVIGGGASTSGSSAGKSVTIGGQTRSGGDRNWRNNNPGNIEYGPFAISMGAIASDGRFAIFPTEEMGRKAADTLLKGKNYVNLSAGDAIKRWAPPSENDTNAYVNSFKKAGLDMNKKYADMSPAEQAKFLDIQAKVEGGRAGVVSGPNSGYKSSNIANPSASLPTAASSNASAANAETDTPAWLESINGYLEQSIRKQDEANDKLGRIGTNTAV